jgi:glycosyltransferase involved in cell wall biosynthesis
LTRWLITKWSTRWISYGESSTEYLVALKVPRNRILQIQNCVDERLYEEVVGPALALTPKPVLLVVGRCIASKGLEPLLDAVASLQKEGVQFTLLIVGDGPAKRSLQRQASAHGLRNVLFHGEVPPDRMPGIYRSCDALIFPTLGDVWGLVVNEAIWCGLPVAASIYAGCAKELLPPESLFDPTRTEELKEALRRAVSGLLPAPDRTRLMRVTDVATLIADEIDMMARRRGTEVSGAGNA